MRVRVWDLPLRLFHWLLVLLIAAAWWTGENDDLVWHYRIGFLALILIVFRLIWGFIGSSTARFASFIRGPRAILAYLRGASPHAVGHNPLGALSVIALLGLVAVVVGLGLFATDEDGIDPGPLSHYVSLDAAEEAADLHELFFDALLVVIAIHVAAILWYALFRRDNLIGPMITGAREAPPGTEPMRPVSAWRFWLALVLAFALTWWVWTGASG